MSNKYSTSIYWSETDHEFVATCTEFSYLSGIGETKEEALTILNKAIEDAIEMFIEDNEPVPTPQFLPEYSGNTRLRMAKNLHKDLVETAKLHGISLNQYINLLLSKNHTYNQVGCFISEIHRQHTTRKMVEKKSIKNTWKPTTIPFKKPFVSLRKFSPGIVM